MENSPKGRDDEKRYYEYSTVRELAEAKQRKEEQERVTRLARRSLHFALVFLILLLALTAFYLKDRKECEIDSEDAQHDYICKELQKTLNCRKTIDSPLRVEVMLSFDTQVKASFLVMCGWEVATSELRACFTLISLYAVWSAFAAMRENDKRRAEMYGQSGFFFGILLLIGSLFDVIAIWDSQMNNVNVCALQDEF